MEIFLGSHHFLLIMKHTPPPLIFPASAVLSIRKTEKLSDGVTAVSGTEGVSHVSDKPATAIRRKAFGPVLKKMTALGLQPFLIYPAVIKLRHKGEQRSYDSPQKAEDFISSMSQQKSYAVALRGGAGRGGGGCGRCFSSWTGGA